MILEGHVCHICAAKENRLTCNYFKGTLSVVKGMFIDHSELTGIFGDPLVTKKTSKVLSPLSGTKTFNNGERSQGLA